MKKFIFFLFLTACMVSVKAQENRGILRGSIQNTRKELLAGISLQLEKTNSGTTTNEDGFYEIRNLAPGKYTLRISGIGYVLTQENVEIKPNETTTLYLQLNEETKVLEQVTVTALPSRKYLVQSSSAGTRLPLPLLETPETIRVIPQQLIIDQQAQNLNDVSKNMTGVITNSMYTSYTMRGFTNSYNNQFIVFDGYMGNMYWWNQMVQLYNIDRVEEIAGPASALFSTGSPGGVINMVTKKPLERAAYSFNLTTGSFGLIDASADMGGALSKNKKLLYRLNIGFNNQNSFRASQFNENIMIAPSLAYHFSSRTSLSLDYIKAYNKTRFAEDHGGLVLMNPDSSYDWKNINIRFLFNSPRDYASFDYNNLTLLFNHQFSDKIQLTFMSRYIWSALNQAEHYGDYFSNNYFTSLPDSMVRSYDTWVYNNYNFQNSLFVSFALGKGQVRQTLLGGVDFQLYGDTRNRYINGPAPSVSFTNPNYSNDNFNYPIDSNTYVWDVISYNRQLGVYVQDLISIGDRLKVLIAGRYENFLFLLKPNSSDTYVTNDSSEAQVFLPRLGIVYNLSKTQSVYGSYCQSFTPQYDNMRYAGGPFPPEKGEQYEIGYKGIFFDGKLFSTLALYTIEYKNVLAQNPNDPSGLQMIAMPGLTSSGAEISFQGSLNKQWSLIAGYAYNHIVFLDNSPLGPKGGRYSNAPNNVANVWVKYSVPEKSALKGLNFSLGGQFVGNRVGSTDNQHFLMPAYFIPDAAISYQYRGFTLGFNANNLINKQYAVGYYASDLMVQVGAPFNWKLSLRYDIK